LAGLGVPESRAASRPALGGHVAALDGVRGLAILMVLLFHFVAQTTATNRFEAVTNGLLGYGLLGVDLFFVLSGFLITGILYDARSGPGYFRSFYARRVLRIFPLYYGVLAVVFLVLPLLPSLRGSELVSLRQHQAWAWLYGVNVYLSLQGGWVLSYIEHFWSLAVEEHFYFVWPLVVWWLGRRPKILMGAALGIAGASLAGRAAASLFGVGSVATTVLTPFQLDALCLGGFLAVWLRQPGGEAAVRRMVVPLGLAVALALVGEFSLHRFTDLGLDLARAVRGGLFRLMFAVVLLVALFSPAASVPGRFFRSRPMVWLGKYSYGLYVYHHFFSYYFVKHGTEFALARLVGSHTGAVLLQAAAGMAVSMAVAWLSYELVETHFLRLKRFWPAASAAGVPGASLLAVPRAPVIAVPLASATAVAAAESESGPPRPARSCDPVRGCV
jgi:peptidoglycan/LPS O-acetylase OafA/YrhL